MTKHVASAVLSSINAAEQSHLFLAVYYGFVEDADALVVEFSTGLQHVGM